MKNRYEVREASGGKYKRFYVWDNNEKRVQKGNITKLQALFIEHDLNGRKFKAVERAEEEARKAKEEEEKKAAEITSEPVVHNKEETVEKV